MSIDQHIRDLAEAGTVAALQEHLPGILASFTLPADPDERLTISEAAEFLRMPEKTVRERIRDERLLAFRDGTRLYVLRRDLVAYNDAVDGDMGEFSGDWRAILPDGTLVDPATSGALHWDRLSNGTPQLNTSVTSPGTADIRFSSLTTAAGVDVPSIAQLLMLSPNSDTQTNRGTLYIDNSVSVERLARRGGTRSDTSRAGLTYLSGNGSRSSANSAIGGRPAFVF